MTAEVVLVASTELDARGFLRSWPALRSPVLRVVTVHSPRRARGVRCAALYVTPAARRHTLLPGVLAEIAPGVVAGARVLPPKSRPPRPEEWRQVGGGQAASHRLPDPRGDGIRRAAELIRAGAPVGQVAAVLRDAARAHIRPLYERSQPATQVTIDRTLAMLPEAVELAGQVVELPPAAARTAAEDFEDQVDRDGGVPLRQRKHRGRPVRSKKLGETECDVCGWAPERTGHARPGRDAELSVRMAHNPNGEDD